VSGTLSVLALVFLFIAIGAFFAAAEIALVSLREGQVRSLGQRGQRGRRVAKLHEDPNRFLAAVQVGVTLAGFLAAAFGASSLAGDFAPKLVDAGVPEGFAEPLALVVITLVITYLSIVFSELVPKRLALQHAERTALRVAPVLDRVASAFRPLIWLLSASTNAVVRLFGGDPNAQRESISEEELRDIVAGHEQLGREERQLIEDVFEAGERQLHEVMVPRTEVDFLDSSTPVFKALRSVSTRPHSRYPVIRGTPDDVIGFIHVRDLFAPEISGQSVRVGEIARPVKQMPGTKRVLSALSELRREGHHLAIVVDEYGGTDGIVTMEDLMEEVIGEIHDEYDVEEEQTRSLRGGDIEVDGLLNLEDFEDKTALELPDGPYETVAGFVIHQLGRLPAVGERVEALGHRFTVTELDGRRVAKVRLSALPATEPSPETSSEA
jgi:putative hemolysin